MVAFWVILIIVLIILKLSWKLVKPIFDWIYYLIVNFFMDLGLSIYAARAIVALIIILVILGFFF